MSRRAILLIGTEKTGTTTLQHFLAANRERLAERGFRYPGFCGSPNHTGLAAYALDPGKSDPLRAPFSADAPADVPSMRARLHAAAAAELTGEATTIFCSEHCHSRLTTAEEVATLRSFLGGFFDEIRIGVYLRRQDQVALSLYSTRLKSGEVAGPILPRANDEDPFFNYDRSLALWEAAFGREVMTVRLFDRKALVGGSVVDDFVATWGLEPIGAFVPVADQNESITPPAQDFLRRMNARLEPVAGLPIDEVRGPLAARLAVLCPGRGARPARVEAEAFYAKYQPSNERLRARFFPERAQLFDEDFSGYPEAADAREATLDDLAGIAARLHTSAVGESRRLEAEIAIRDGRLHWTRAEPEAAERALRRALRWWPGHAAAHRTLAEYLFRLDRLDEAVATATRAAELSPESHEYQHFRGILLRRAGDLAAAADAQRRSLALNPGHTPSRHELEQVLIRQADVEARQAIAGNGHRAGGAAWPSPASP
jgi:tetratricopeptide (TPR) repeat protein